MITIAVQLLIVMTIIFCFIFLGNGRSNNEPRLALWWVPIGFGTLSLILALIINGLLIEVGVQEVQTLALSSKIRIAVSVGITEELVKFVPAAIYLWRKKYFNQYTDGLIYFGLIGLFFGMVENFYYGLGFGGFTSMFRIAFNLYFHAALSAIVGYYLAKAKIDKKGIYKVFLALVSVMLIHAVYDLLLFTGGAPQIFLAYNLAIIVNASMFAYYFYAKKLDKKLLYVENKSPNIKEGNVSNYCHGCGNVNSQKTDFCIHCGAKLTLKK
jgi:RsiW-degrading membrane proteinase PrsW (M82 family)